MPTRARLAFIAAPIALAAFQLAPSVADAGGWTQAEGGYYAKVWNRSLIGSQAFLTNGETLEVPSFQDHALNVYGEYGLTDAWTVLAFTNPVGTATFDGNSTTYVGGSFLGVRRALLTGELPVAIEVHYGYAPPIGDDNLATAPVEGADGPILYVPTVSTHRIDSELQLGYGIPNGWVTAAVGGRWQSADGIDPLVYTNAQIGYSASFGLVADFHVAWVEPLGDVTVTNVAGAGQTRYFGLGIGLSYWLTEHVGVNVGGDGVIFASSNAATPSLTAGVEFK